MKVINVERIKVAQARYPNDAGAFTRWVKEARQAEWKTTQDIRNRYRTADFLSGNRVVFDIAGNNCRLVVAVKFERGTVMVIMAGSHAEYDKWNRRQK
jgi:mRNA interferase HigB